MPRATSTNVPTHDRWLTADEAAAYLQVSKTTLRRCVTDGQLPGYRIRRQLRFKLSDVEKAFSPVPTVGYDR